jgi:hypothetical protein
VPRDVDFVRYAATARPPLENEFGDCPPLMAGKNSWWHRSQGDDALQIIAQTKLICGAGAARLRPSSRLGDAAIIALSRGHSSLRHSPCPSSQTSHRGKRTNSLLNRPDCQRLR